MIKAPEFNRIRKKAMKTLAPDFVHAKSIYTRENDNMQIQSISCKPFGRDGEYYVDHGIHYSFLPSFKIFLGSVKANHPEPETSALNTRLFVDGSSTYPYGETAVEAESELESRISECLMLFDEFEKKWGNGDALLDMLTPETMRQDAIDFNRLLSMKPDDQSKTSAALACRQALPGHKPLVGPMIVMLACIAKHHRTQAVVGEYLELMKMPGMSRYFSTSKKEVFLPYLLAG